MWMTVRQDIKKKQLNKILKELTIRTCRKAPFNNGKQEERNAYGDIYRHKKKEKREKCLRRGRSK